MLLGERNGSNKYEVCPYCHQDVMMVLDHGTDEWVHRGCPERADWQF